MTPGNPPVSPGVSNPEGANHSILGREPVVISSQDLDSILIGSELTGRIIYQASAAGFGRRWVRYQVRPDGTLDQPTVVFSGEQPAGWRGLPEFE